MDRAQLDERALPGRRGHQKPRASSSSPRTARPFVTTGPPKRKRSGERRGIRRDFVSGTAKCLADLGAARAAEEGFHSFKSPLVAVLDNNLYYQFGVLARVYDWKSGGKQTFPVLIPQDMTPGSISVESLGPQQAGNGRYETLRVSSPDLEIMVYVDLQHTA